MITDFSKVCGGIFLVHGVADYTGEADVGLGQGLFQRQGPGDEGWSQCPCLIQVPGWTTASPGHIQVLCGSYGCALQSDVAPV